MAVALCVRMPSKVDGSGRQGVFSVFAGSHACAREDQGVFTVFTGSYARAIELRPCGEFPGLRPLVCSHAGPYANLHGEGLHGRNPFALDAGRGFQHVDGFLPVEVPWRAHLLRPSSELRRALRASRKAQRSYEARIL